MVEIIFVVCLLAQPAECERIRPAFVQPMSLGACMREGQFHAIRWLEEHRGWRLRGWRCALPDT